MTKSSTRKSPPPGIDGASGGVSCADALTWKCTPGKPVSCSAPSPILLRVSPPLCCGVAWSLAVLPAADEATMKLIVAALQQDKDV